MSFKQQLDQMKKIGEQLLAEGKAEVILGFSKGSAGNAIPHFIRTPKDLQALQWDAFCTPVLAKYLMEQSGKTAIMAKPCDARAILMYTAEGQLSEKTPYIIGVECYGMKNPDGSDAPGCAECTHRVPPVYDCLIPLHDAQAAQKTPQLPGMTVSQPESFRPWERFQRELKRCILCFSCRQTCYGCYCETCFIDRDLPNWRPADLSESTKMTFHLGRAMHLAGRCVGCGACERVCPKNVQVRYLIQELNDLCKAEYGYEAGINPGAAPVLAAHAAEDKDTGFWGGDGDAACSHKKG